MCVWEKGKIDLEEKNGVNKNTVVQIHRKSTVKTTEAQNSLCYKKTFITHTHTHTFRLWMHCVSFIGYMCHIAEESVLISVQRYSIWQSSLDSLTFRNNKRLNCIKASKTATVHLFQRAEHERAICGSLFLPLTFLTKNNLKFANSSYNCLSGQDWSKEQVAGFYFDFFSLYSTVNIVPSFLIWYNKVTSDKRYPIKAAM